MTWLANGKALAADGIKVNAADPGYTATDLNGHSGPRTAEEADGVAGRARAFVLGPSRG